MQLMTGQDQSTLTSEGLQAAGMSKQNADLVDGGVSIALTGGAGALAKTPQLSSAANATANASKVETVAANRLNHIFGKSEHALENLVTKFGSQEKAFNAVQNAANQALKAGKLTPNAEGVLPSVGEILNVGGMNVRLIGGKIKDGKVIISSFSRKAIE